jgi:iron complex transport system substrate-binding protein
MRIISLLPSATEIICLLDLQDDLVGITHECDYPMGLDHLPIVTHSSINKNVTSRAIDNQVRDSLQHTNALYTLNDELIERLQPDLFVTQSLCNVCAVDHNDVLKLAQKLTSTPVIVNLEPVCLDDIYATLQQLGEATQRLTLATQKIAHMQQRVQHSARPRVVFLEWIDPLFNSGHWIPEIIHLAGGEDMLGTAGDAAVRLEWSQICAIDPEFLVVSCCGYNLEQTQRDLEILQNFDGWQQLRCVQTQRCFVVDGNAYFSRPSPRLLDSLEIMSNILNNKADSRYQLITA